MLEKLRALSDRAGRTRGLLETEEATKNALVMPFITAMGYDVFDPTEVVPEFTADLGLKKGEKVDYAIKRDDEIVMLFEAKKAAESLNIAHAGQLYRYFSVTNARIGVLTNGYVYQFFSDLDEPNKMDQKPFIEIDLLDLKDSTALLELQKLCKDSFDLGDMLTAAGDLKHLGEIRRELEEQLTEPDEEFVKYFFSKANSSGRFVQSARDQFSRLVKQAMKELINERVSDRLRSALSVQTDDTPTAREEPNATLDNDEDQTESVGEGADIVTTDDELEGFRMVRAIVCSELTVKRVSYRDSKSYFAVLCDDNNRKPICRLHFNSKQYYLGVLDASKKETRHRLERLEDLYNFADDLRDAARRYVEDSPQTATDLSA